MAEFSSFEEFFPFYVGQHSRAATRWAHFGGTHLGLAMAVAGALRRRPRLIALAPVVAYGVAWASHFGIEGNRPATFGHPAWSLRGDVRMLSMMWQGRDAELDAMARRSRAAGPERSIRVA